MSKPTFFMERKKIFKLIIKQNSTLCCIQEMHLKLSDSKGLKIRVDKDLRGTILMSKQISSSNIKVQYRMYFCFSAYGSSTKIDRSVLSYHQVPQHITTPLRLYYPRPQIPTSVGTLLESSESFRFQLVTCVECTSLAA